MPTPRLQRPALFRRSSLGPLPDTIRRRHRRRSVGVLTTATKGGIARTFKSAERRPTPAGARFSASPGAHTTARWERFANDVMRNHWQPEMRLWATVLVETVKDLTRPASAAMREAALAWVREVDPTYTLFTFSGVCCQLDIDEDFVRGDLLRRCAEEPRLRVVA